MIKQNSNMATSASISFKSAPTDMEVDEVDDKFKYKEEDRAKAFKYVGCVASAILMSAKIIDIEDYSNNLDFSMNLAGASSTLHNQLRKNASNNGMTTEAFNVRVATITGSHSANMGTAMGHFKTLHPDAPDFKVICPIFNMMTSFKLIKNEARVGCNKIMTRKSKVAKKESVSVFGLAPRHSPYLKGCTIKPERRSGLMQCIGPLAHGIFLLEDKTYTDKSKRAMKECIKHLPMHESIITCLSINSRATVGGLLGALGDLLLVTTDRTHNKMTLPFICYLNILIKKGKDSFTIHEKVLSEMIDFSGKKAVVFYREHVAGKKFKWLTTETTASLSAEVFFHGCFGTHFEDLGVLKQITNIAQFHPRSELSKTFVKENGKEVEFLAPKFTYVSKMLSACGTKMMGSTEPMVQCKPVFSGKRKRCFSDELMNALKDGGGSAYDSTPLSLTKVLNDKKKELLQKGLNTDFGTTAWYPIAGVTKDSWGTASEFVPEESGVYLF